MIISMTIYYKSLTLSKLLLTIDYIFEN